MKPSLPVGLVATVLFLGGCQSLNWTASSKTTKENPAAANVAVREVPWTWRKKKNQTGASEMPPELAAKFDKAKQRSDANKSAVEWIAEGNQQELSRNLPAARKAYEQALVVDPVNAEAHHRLGILADMRQEYGVSQDHFEAALRQKPHDPNLLSDFGYSHYLRGNVHQSERYLLQALDVDAQHRQAVKNLGTLYASQGRYDDALQAFRRVRPEAEAQDLMAKYFPDGRPAAKGNTQLASTRNTGESRTAPPMPPDTIDPATLKGKSQQEIVELMDQQREAARRAREQKDRAEFQPNLQSSMTEEDYRAAAGNSAATGREFPRDAVPPNGAMQNASSGSNNRSVPPGLGQTAAAPGREWAQNPAAANDNSPPVKEEFWSGAPLQRGSAAPPNNRPAGPPQNYANNSWQQNGQDPSVAGNQYQPAPWAAEGQAAARRPLEAESANFDSSRNAMPSTEMTAGQWNRNPPANNGQAGSYNQPAQQLSPQQRAYQLGMSVGPGTMFPAVGAEANANSPPANGNTWAGSQWTNSTTPTGYSQTSASGQWDNGSASNSQWREAPLDSSPRSPTESWGPPSMMSLPQGNPGDASQRGPAQQPAGAQLPVINPGTNWGAGAANTPRAGNKPNWGRNDAGSSPNNASGPSGSASDVVPAWYDSSTNASAPPTRSGSPSSVPQWPYAPR